MAIGIKKFLAKQFVSYDFTGRWYDSFGLPERCFKMYLYGEPGNGKTSYCIQLAKYMANFSSRILYNSKEEGISKSLQDAIRRENLMEVNGKILFESLGFDDLYARLEKPRSANIIFIDSRDYMELTKQQYKKLTERFPNKAFIITGWMEGNRPAGQHAKGIEHMCDIKVKVQDYVAYPRSRFGGKAAPFVIWDKGQLRDNKQKGDKKVTNSILNEIPHEIELDEWMHLHIHKVSANQWTAGYYGTYTNNCIVSSKYWHIEHALSELRDLIREHGTTN